MFNKKNLFLGLALQAILLAGCNPSPNQNLQQNDSTTKYTSGIFGGTEVTEKNLLSKSVVAISLRDQFGSEKLCTGALLSSEYVITASHCLGSSLESMRVYFLLNIEDRLKPNFMNYRSIIDARKSDTFHGSLAILKLNSPAPNNSIYFTLPSSLQTNELMTGIYKIAGFGAESFDRETRQVTGSSTLKMAELNKIPDIKHDKRFIILSQNEGSGVCVGDSGGPLYLRVENKFILQGIAFKVQNPNGQDLCRGVSYFTSITNLEGWIAMALRDLSMDY